MNPRSNFVQEVRCDGKVSSGVGAASAGSGLGRALADRKTWTSPVRKGRDWAKVGKRTRAALSAMASCKGQTLGEVFAREGAAFAGRAAAVYPRFPLLVKFIDAHENLSIQVHPNDDLARQLENYPYGKTEFWYVLDAAPDAHIYYGLNAPDIAREDLQAALENQDLLRYLNRVPVQAGDVVYMPAGTIHALTAGVVVYELQQDSDITYRLYDWGRTGREIHLEKGLQAIDPGAPTWKSRRPVFTEQAGNQRASLVNCGFFHSQLWRVPHTPVCHRARREFYTIDGD